MQRTIKDYLVISLKGLAMGAADVVPGVSGGTIAFISGIYNELIDSISAFNLKNLKVWKSNGFVAFFKAVNGYFLLSLFTGIGISVLSLANVFKYLLETKPILVWAFFFGLVLASVLFIAKQITKWNILHVFLLLVGAITAYYITTIPATNGVNNSSIFLVFAGALAICAMILPGISGAMILLLLGAYKPAIDALHNFDIKKISLLILGAIIGLLTFSRVLKWLFDHYKNATLAVLTGFVIGSLNKIWPWKKVTKLRLNSNDEWVYYSDYSVLPNNYDVPMLDSLSKTGIPSLYQQTNPQIFHAIILAILGFSLILLLEKLGNKKIS